MRRAANAATFLAGLTGLACLAAATTPGTASAAGGTKPAAAHAPKKPAGKKPSGKDAQYQAAVKSWHAAAPTIPAAAGGTPPTHLVLVSLNSGERVELEAHSDTGSFSARDAEEARWLFRERGSGRSHPIEPKLLDTLYRIQRHFAAPLLRVVSGYRTPKPGSHSNHGRGRACDFVVPGTSDKDVTELARSYGFRGVGIYPKSGFVHVDIRERSYFWVDTSGPGKKHRERSIMAGQVGTADREARARGEVPPLPYSVKPPTAEKPTPAPDPMHEDDDDDDDDDADGS